MKRRQARSLRTGRRRCAPGSHGIALLLGVVFVAATAAVAATTPGPTPAPKPSGAVGVPGAPGTLGAAAKPPGAQAIRVDAVHIEGKLYSPQALFIVTRPAESFGRDAIVPAYLTIGADAAALPYRLREPVLEAAGRALAAPATVAPPRPAPTPATAPHP
jgi:hypothetical protein